MKRFLFPTLVSALLIALTVSPAHAVTITYEATDLTDTTPGEDLWQYTYWVSDYTFDTDYGFWVWFDYTLYEQLEDPPPYVNDDWDPVTIQPNPGISEDGIYDALALVDSASLSDPFTLSFVWLGTGEPDSQPFDIYEYDSVNFEYNTLESGQTTAIPLPFTLLFLGSGLLFLYNMRKWMNS